MRFEKFVANNEAKRRQDLKKYNAAQEENISKQSEIEELTEELKRLKVRWLMTPKLISLSHSEVELGLKLSFYFTGSKF